MLSNRAIRNESNVVIQHSFKEHGFMNMKDSFDISEGIHILSCRILHRFHSRQIAPVESHTKCHLSWCSVLGGWSVLVLPTTFSVDVWNILTVSNMNQVGSEAVACVRHSSSKLITTNCLSKLVWARSGGGGAGVRCSSVAEH